MLSFILVGITVFVSWILGLSFIQPKKDSVFVNAGITAALSILLSWLAEQAGQTFLLSAVIPGLFLLETAAIQLQCHGHFGNSVIAFCLALAAFSAFCPLLRFAQRQRSPLIISVWSCFVILLVIFYLMFYKRFPGSDWPEFFRSSQHDQSRLNIQQAHIYAVGAVLCAVNAILLITDTAAIWQTIAACTAALALLWTGMLLIILMTFYKKERLTVLLEQQYRTEMQAFMNVIRSQRHDYNFHVQTIAGLIAGNKIEECRSYVNALEKDSAEMNVLMPIKDPAISATIFSFQLLAIRNGISLHIDIEYDLSQIATDVYETNKILSNLLQNAIDEVSAHTDKSFGIWLTIIKRGEFCVIRVSNKVKDILQAEQLGRLYDQGYTTKKGHEGVGLSSIRLLAERYHGIIYTQTEDDIIHFIARIPINTAKQEEY